MNVNWFVGEKVHKNSGGDGTSAFDDIAVGLNRREPRASRTHHSSALRMYRY